MPTYKFVPGTNEYAHKEGTRIPSYTDRILYESRIFMNDIQYYSYKEPIDSDHKPVILTFGIIVNDMSRCNIISKITF